MVVSCSNGFRLNHRKTDVKQKIHQKWPRPPEGKLKLNVDGSYDQCNGAGAGMALRDILAVN
jgi:hypothetical protein